MKLPMRLHILSVSLAIPWLISCQTGKSPEEPCYQKALENGFAANEGFRRCMDYAGAWLEYADPVSGLIPENLGPGRDIWNAHNAAADNYPFLVLTSYLLDRELYQTVMQDMLRTERKLTSRLGSLPDDYSFSRQRFSRPEIDTGRIVFGASEYIKDGILPLTEYLGGSPWSQRMLEMLDDLPAYASVTGRMDPQKFSRPVEDEINGELLQTLSRVYWMTGEEKYLLWAIRIGEFYLFDKRLEAAERLRLRDHGCEIIGGLSECYAALHFTDPRRKAEWQPRIHRIMDRILEVGRNEDGMFYNEVNMRTGELLDSTIVDNWGYIYNAYYTVYLLDQRTDYRDAVILPLKSLGRRYRNFDWERGGADGFADAIESGINLYNRERIPELKDWIDSEVRVMWSLQDSSYRENAQVWRNSGIIEGWHGDGNFARTTLMYCLLMTGDLTIHPWRADVIFGAVEMEDGLCIALRAGQEWEGTLVFPPERYRDLLNLPMDYPRINQFPQWFTVGDDRNYSLSGGLEQTLPGAVLKKGIPLKLRKNETIRIQLSAEDPRFKTGA